MKHFNLLNQYLVTSTNSNLVTYAIKLTETEL